MRRLAEAGTPTKEIAAVSGHKTLREVERYTAAADQAHLARSAIGRLNRNGALNRRRVSNLTGLNNCNH